MSGAQECRCPMPSFARMPTPVVALHEALEQNLSSRPPSLPLVRCSAVCPFPRHWNIRTCLVDVQPCGLRTYVRARRIQTEPGRRNPQVPLPAHVPVFYRKNWPYTKTCQVLQQRIADFHDIHRSVNTLAKVPLTSPNARENLLRAAVCDRSAARSLLNRPPEEVRLVSR